MAEVENGVGILLTRRGKEVGKLVPMQEAEDPRDRKVDWASWVLARKEILAGMPKIEGNAMDLERESDCRGYKQCGTSVFAYAP